MTASGAQRTRGRAAKSLRCLELAAWTLGMLLVVTYASARWWYAHGREAGIAAFDVARNEVLRSPPTVVVAPSDDVDMSTWSRERIERYRESAHTGAVPLAVLRIPSVKVVVPVFDGTSHQNLNRGAGRIEGTARLGETGNVGIAAHRDGFFRALKDVRVGDVLLLEQLTTTDVYRIVATTIVEPSDVSVLGSTAAPTVTLVTCYPFYYVGAAPQRFIVRAQLVPAKKTAAEQAGSR
jgi:sortase A